MESGKNRPSTSGYSLREREKQLYTDETTPTHSSPDVEYTPREKKDYCDNEDIIPLKRVDSSCEIISIENITPSPKNVEVSACSILFDVHVHNFNSFVLGYLA